MKTPTFDTRALATLFLIGVAGIAAWSALAGTSPDQLALVPCPARALAGVPCPGCGMTRACVALARGQVGSAWSLHPFAFVLVPLAAFVAFSPAGTKRTWARVPGGLRSTLVGLALAFVLGTWALRLV